MAGRRRYECINTIYMYSYLRLAAAVGASTPVHAHGLGDVVLGLQNLHLNTPRQ